MHRDDFSAPVKALLAVRAGHRCSYPQCGQVTSGPSGTSEGSINIGVAAHITGASPGGRRHDARLTPEERASYANGIWMCQNHAHAIDVDDPCTVEQLQAWKASAVTAARVGVLGRGGEGNSLSLDLADIYPGIPPNLAIGTTLERCGISKVWGRSEHGCVQDVLIEIALNALAHGGARRVGLNIGPFKITLYDDGGQFDPLRQLPPVAPPKGGSSAVDNIRRAHGLDLLLTHRRHEGLNELTIMRIENLQREGLPLDPCTVSVTHDGLNDFVRTATVEFSGMAGCGDVVAILPEYMGLSQAYIAVMMLAAAFPSAPPPLLHLVVSKASQYVVSILEEGLPGVRILRASW